MKEYTIVKKSYEDNAWGSIEPAWIDTYKWMDNGYEPKVSARIFHDGKSIYIRFEVEEEQITARYFKMHEDVYKDSCVEFFFRPANDERYFNFEVNVVGTMLLGFGAHRDSRERVEVNPDIFEMKPSVTDAEGYCGNMWSLEYKIPFSFLDTYYGGFDPGVGLFANLYKCGDETVKEHYGMWNVIQRETADFHRPEFFGRMSFEQ